ncbi:MAG: nucleotidyltransferase substrate binding protein [Pseudomonadota bacterium]
MKAEYIHGEGVIMPLDLSSLKKAVDSLERTIGAAISDDKMNALDADQRDAIRAGVIQNFEFTYKLSWKMMKRWLEHNLGNVQVDGVSRRELFRLGAESQLIDDVEQWMEFHSARNETAHTYDQETAGDVFQVALRFLGPAKGLLMTLESKND